MKLRHKLLFVVILAMISAVSRAEPFYVGGGYTLGSFEEDELDLDLNSIFFRFGYELHDSASLELRVGTAAGDDAVDFFGFKLDVKVKSIYGVYYKVGIPRNSSIFPYGILGYTKGKLEISGFGTSNSGSESSLSYGAGVDIGISENVVFNVEYLKYIDKGSADLSGFTLSVNYRI